MQLYQPTNSAGGRTGCCVRHGGGKRCNFESCGKSAQGSTDFCKAHGGGKRCVCGDGECEKFARGKSGLCAAHSHLMMQEREAEKGSRFDSRLFHGLVPSASITLSGSENNNSSSGVSVVPEHNDYTKEPAKQQCFILEELPVPLSIKSSSSSLPHFLATKKPKEGRNKNILEKDIDFDLPEGRVQGGDLMLPLGRNFKNAASVV